MPMIATSPRKNPAKTGNFEEDELMSLLWGTSAANVAAVSDDETEKETKKKKTGAGAPATAARPRQTRAAAKATSDAASSAGDTMTGPGALFTMMKASKKNGNETKDLDKSEALVLQSKQMALQMEDFKTFAQLSLAKASSLLDKIDARLAESSKTFVEMIRLQGPGCRAELTMQSLKDGKASVQAIHDLLEAFHDSEASPATLRTRVRAVQTLNIPLPIQVNNVVCQRSIVAMAEDDKVHEILKFIDLQFKDEHPDGVVSVLPSGLAEDALALIAAEFQSGCICHVLNQLFLKECGDGESLGFFQ